MSTLAGMMHFLDVCGKLSGMTSVLLLLVDQSEGNAHVTCLVGSLFMY